MRRYWLSFAMLLMPCLAIGGWAIWVYEARWKEDVAALQASWQVLAQSTAQEELTRELEHFRQMVTEQPSDLATLTSPRTGEGTLHDPQLPEIIRRLEQEQSTSISDLVILTAHGAVLHSFPNLSVGAQITGGSGASALEPRLLQAEGLEFSSGNLRQALDLYRSIRTTAHGVVEQEAEAGEVGCLLKLHDDDLAAFELSRALDAKRVNVHVAAAMALAVARSQANAGLTARLLLQSWYQTLCCERDTVLSEHVHGELLAHFHQLSEPEQQRMGMMQRLLDHDQQAEAYLADLSSIDRHWLTEETGQSPTFRRILSGDLVEAIGDHHGNLVIARVDEVRLGQAINTALQHQPGLEQLADAIAVRFGGASHSSWPLVIEPPWGGTLHLNPAPRSTASHGIISPHLPAISVAAAAAVAIITGFLVLLRTARTDRRLAKLQADFVSTVSHEMKTPLSLIRMYGEMLTLGYARSEHERGKYHQIILQESERLATLVENVLQASALDQRAILWSRQPCDLSNLVAEIIGAYRPRLEAEGFAVTLALPQPGPLVDADRDAMTQVIVNLLSNAMKYSPNDRRIRISTSWEEGEAVLAVADRGIGIAPEHHHHIFARFYRIDNGLSREAAGVGLGLNLVKAIVVAHGGRIEVESRLGAGSIFTIRLPHSQSMSIKADATGGTVRITGPGLAPSVRMKTPA